MVKSNSYFNPNPFPLVSLNQRIQFKGLGYKFLSVSLLAFFFNISLAQLPLDASKFKELADSPSPRKTKSDSATAAKKKTSKPKNFPSSQPFQLALFNNKQRFISDTSNLNSHMYDPNYLNNQAWVNLGEPAGPTKVLGIATLNPGLNIGLNPMGSLKKTNQNFNFYQVQAPLTLMRYTQGTGSSFAFNALHTQNLSPTWNITLDYQSIINENMFLGAGLNSTSRNTFLGSNFTSPNGKFHQIILFGWNRLRRNENGGIKPADFYQYAQIADSTQFGQRTFNFYSPYLSTPAKSFFGNNQHSLAHQYSITKTIQLTQYSTFEKTRFQYADTKRDTNFYGKNYFHYASKTNDSSVWLNQNHLLGMQFIFQQDSTKNNLFSFNYAINKANYQSLLPLWKDSSSPKNYQSKGLQFHWLNSNYQPNKISFQLFGNYTLNGNGKTAHLIKAEFWIQDIIKNPSPKPYQSYALLPKLSLKLERNLQLPTLFDQQFASNHFFYNNNFNYLTGIQNIVITANRIQLLKSKKVSMESPKILTELHFNAELGKWLNPVLSVDAVQPMQFNFTANYTKFTAQFHQRINHFYIYQNITYHKFKDNYLNPLFNMGVPKIYSKTSLFFQYYLFNKAMLAKTGIDIWYTSEFTPMQYRPDAATIYYNTLQPFKSGNYAQIDWYISARIQTADIFFKIEHANELYHIPGFNTRYDYVLYHPIQPYRVRFGLQWKFYN